MNDIRNADDTALIADSGSKLQDIVDKIVTKRENFGISFNVMIHIVWLY